MKRFIVAVCIVVVACTAAVILTLSNLGPMVKEAVNTLGPQVTKTDVKVDDVSISILSGEAEIKGFLLGNPKGFKSAQAMTVDSIAVDIEESTVTENPIVINKIEIIAPEISYEKISGTDNFKALMKNIQSSAKSDKPKAKPGSDKPGKKIVINNVIVKSGKVNLIMAALGGQEISAELPDIHLKDIGKEKQGASPAEAAEKIFAALYQNISADAVTNVLNDKLKDLGNLKNIDISKLGSGSIDETGKAAESAKESVEKATESLKGLFK